MWRGNKQSIATLLHSSIHASRLRTSDAFFTDDLHLFAGDPVGDLNIHVYNDGDELGWHMDRGEFAVTIHLQVCFHSHDFCDYV